jgi:hypothetical protein
MGSVADRIVRRARVPVLLYPTLGRELEVDPNDTMIDAPECDPVPHKAGAI